MADDFDPNGIPPKWALDIAADESGYRPNAAGRDPYYWGSGSKSFRALAFHVWKYEQPPLDPDMAAMREAIAAFIYETGGETSETSIRAGRYDAEVTAALAAFRKAQAK